MTTESGKKTPKTPKSGKAAASRGRRKKTVDKAPAPTAIDKEKMAAFFSAGGIDDAIPASVKRPEKVGAPKDVESEKSGAVLAAEVKVATVVESEPSSELAAPVEAVAASPENDSGPKKDPGKKLPESDSELLNDGDNFNNSEGETLMKTNSKASGNGSGSFNVLSMVFVLVVLALFWFYFISSTPLQKAAEIQVVQGKTEISALTTKIKSLEIENSRLKSELNFFKKAALKWKKETKKVNVPVNVGVLPAKKAVIKASPKDQPMPAADLKSDSSFDKAPVPFWRNMKPRGYLIEQSRKKVKPVVKTPVRKVDSFSKAPKPFWLTPRVKPVAAKPEKEVIISVPPAPEAAKCPRKAKSITAKPEPAVSPVPDPSFEKAPKPFWLKD